MCFSARLQRQTLNHPELVQNSSCIATAPTPAARSATATSAQTVRLSGWCHRIRDHGGVLFIDLRDHYGLTQVVADPDSPAFKLAETLRSEWVVRIDGKVRRRPEGTENPDLPTGQVEVYIAEIEVLGPAAELPMPVFGEQEYPGRDPAQVPLPRSAPRAAARQHHAARRGHQLDPPRA